MFGRQTDEKVCGFDKKPCLKTRCMHYQKFIGAHPQTGNPVEDWDCAFNWQNVLQIENTGDVKGVAASIDKLHNDIALNISAPIKALLDAVKTRLFTQLPKSSKPNGETAPELEDRVG